MSVEDDLISLNEIKMWTVDALKDYCKKRSYKVSGTLEELQARVYVLYNKRVPVDPTAAEEARAIKSDYKKLYEEGPGYSANPERLQAWINEKNSINSWPPVSYVDICKFIQKKGCSLTKEALSTYKTGKAFSLFYNDYVQEVYYHAIRKDHPCCYLKAECKHSNKVNDPNHSVWVKVVKETGEICSGYCTCYAGYVAQTDLCVILPFFAKNVYNNQLHIHFRMSEVCNHVTAILFKIESAFRLDISQPTCTTTQCSWNVSKGKRPMYMRLAAMKFSKPCHKKGKGRHSCNIHKYSAF